jgi:DNA-binding response OmpR family regulator/signal transduction histidine kinase
MLRAGLRALVLFVTTLVLTGCGSPRVVEAVDGELDLRGWNLEEVVVAHGEYRIDWDTLERREGAPGDRFRVPGNIGGHWPSRGPFGILQGAGCAVLSLDLSLPDAPSGVIFAFDGLHARVRARSLDGDAATNEVTVGSLSCDPTSNEEVQHWQSVALPRARRVRIAIAVSPQLWGRANINGGFRLGTPGAVMRERTRNTVQRIGSVGVLIGLVSAATVLAAIRRNAAGAWPLAVFVTILAVRTVMSTHFVVAAFPRPWVYTLTLTIEYLAMPLGVAAAFEFFDVTIGLPRRYRPWVLGGAALMSFLIVVAPQAYMSGPVANATKIFTVVATAILVPHALRWRDPTQPHATWAMRGGIVALAVGTLYDIWRSVYAPFGIDMMPLATVLFAFSQKSLVSMRYAAALTTAEGLLDEVDRVNSDLREHGDRVDEFLQHASAELLEPGSAVVALAEGTAAAHGRRLSDELRHAFDLIAQNGRRVALLASEIADMSRSVDAEPSSEPHPVDAELVVRRAVEALRPLLTRRKLEVRIAVEPGVPTIVGDLQRVERAVASMLGFAATYAESGSLAVGLALEDGVVRFTVAANGRFPDPGPLTSPFETVRRLAGAGLPATRLGVGLSTAVRTAARSGGGLSVRVTKEVGALLELRLPGSPGDQRLSVTMGPRSARIAIESAPVRAVRESVGGRPVLVVDDDETIRTLLQQLLERRGFDVWLAADGESAIETIVSAGPPDLVLLDVGLPGLGGLQVLDALRQRYDPATLPILMLTARGMQEEVTEGFRRGANDYMVKPVNFAELDARVAHHAALVEAHRRVRSELEMRRRYEGEIERMAQRASQVEQTLQVMEKQRARLDGASSGERDGTAG